MKIKMVFLFITFLLASSVLAYDFCEEGTVGEDKIRIVSVADMLSENTLEWVWQAYEEIEIETRVQNRGSSSGNYVLEFVFLQDGKRVEIVKTSDDLKKEFKLSSNERLTIPFKFRVDESTSSGKYEMYVKMYLKGEEEKGCVETSVRDIEVIKLEFCNEGFIEGNELEIRKFTDHTEDTENSWIWYPGKEARISVDVRNRDFDEREFYLEVYFVDKDLNVVEIVKDSSSLIKKTTLEKRDTADLVFRFDIEESVQGEYYIYAKFYDSSDEKNCISKRAQRIKVSVERNEREIKLSDIKGPKEVYGGELAIYTLKVSNWGSKDEEKVNLLVYDSLLGIKEDVELGSVGSLETKEVSVSINFPSDFNSTKSNLVFYAEYNYDSRKDFFKEITSDENLIKLRVDVLEKEKSEEKILENETLEEVADVLNGSNKNITTLITGKIVSDVSEFSEIFLTILFLAVMGFGGFFGYKALNKKKNYSEPKIITRKYTASLS